MTVLTPNQVVAFNLALTRRERGLTQAQFCDLLAPYLGVKWSPAVLSAAERSVDGKRVREFDADTIVAIARALGLSVGQLMAPPPDRDVRVATPDHPNGLPRADAAMVADPEPGFLYGLLTGFGKTMPDATVQQALAVYEQLTLSLDLQRGDS